jgi:ribulose-phosphate 3-epimerase
MMDGHYVPNLALTPQHLRALRTYTQLPFHAHLELAQPDRILDNFYPLGADLIIVQWDTLLDPRRTFERIRSQGAKVGLSLNPDDPLVKARHLFPELDVLLILGVYPGFGGQTMLPGTISRISAARQLIAEMGLPPMLTVDGGVSLENAHALIHAGADCLIIGTTLFQAEQLSATVAEIKAHIGSSRLH